MKEFKILLVFCSQDKPIRFLYLLGGALLFLIQQAQ